MEALIAWLVAHWAALVAPIVVAVLDLLFAVSPALNANGLLHALYLFLKNKPAPPQP